MKDVRQEAIGRWPSILSALGVSEQFLRNKQGPCPICGGNTRFRFDDKGGRGTYICNSCGAGDGFALLMSIKGYDFREAKADVLRVLPRAVEAKRRPERIDAEVAAELKRIWRESMPLWQECQVIEYLNDRGIFPFEMPKDLRYHPSMPYYDDGVLIGKFDAMVAAVRAPDGKCTGLHITYLKDGKKAPVESQKKVKGKVPNGAAIRLSTVGDCMIVAEGIETALACEQLFHHAPAWACISEGGLRKFEPPHGLKRMVIAGDNDSNFVGQAAAYELARRMAKKGISVSVEIPPSSGTDWADEVVGR